MPPILTLEPRVLALESQILAEGGGAGGWGMDICTEEETNSPYMNAWVINQNKAFSGWRLEVAVVVALVVSVSVVS